MSIKDDLPSFELPREKALIHGINSLSNVELLAILLRTGVRSKSVLDLSYEIIKTFGQITNLANITYEELCSIKGMKESKSLIILAAIELGKRINFKEDLLLKVDKPSIIYAMFAPMMENNEQESNYCIFVNSKGKMIKYKEMFKGSLSSAYIHPRDIFRDALKANAAGIILLHNHPSGDSNPSTKDIDTTLALESISRQIGIKLIDHIIIGKGNYYSFKENNYL